LHAQLPLIVRERGVLAVKSPADLVPLRVKGPSIHSFEPGGLLEIWDGEDWMMVRGITATRRRSRDPDHDSFRSRPGRASSKRREAHSVRELVQVAFEHVGLDPENHIRIDPRFLRPAEVEHLVGNYSKAREKLGWEPRTSFREMIRLMVDSDLELLSRGVPQQQAG
jgi:hypothetical protein